MATVGADAQPATGHGSAMVPNTRDEEPLPRSESGIERIKTNDYDDIIKLDESLCLNDTNWVFWRVRIVEIFRFCRVEGYVKGTLRCPDPNVDPKGAKNWSHNDAFTRLIISFNVTKSQESNILTCNSAREMWKNLEDDNISQASKTILAYRRRLHHTTAGERDDIVEHLDKLKMYRQKVNFAAFYDDELKISDLAFNKTIAESLPPSWDSFSARYIRMRTFIDDDHDDPETTISSQRFIEVIEQEYRRREQWYHEYLARQPARITSMHCKLCKKRNHNTECCRFLGQPRCGGCGRFGHDTGDCGNNRGKKRKYEDDD